jgi:hypothetical protein
MGVAEVFCCSGKALKLGDGHEIAKTPEFQGKHGVIRCAYDSIQFNAFV